MKSNTSLLKIYISATDRVGKNLLYEEIVREARDEGLAGATVFRGIMSFGASHSIHNINVSFPTNQVPVCIDLIDDEAKIQDFYPKVKKLIDQSEKGALMTLQPINVLTYRSGKKYNQFANF